MEKEPPSPPSTACSWQLKKCGAREKRFIDKGRSIGSGAAGKAMDRWLRFAVVMREAEGPRTSVANYGCTNLFLTEG